MTEGNTVPSSSALQHNGVATVRALLRSLADDGEPLLELPATTTPGALARWLVAAGLGPLAYRRYQQSSPALAAALAADYYSAVAENSLFRQQLQRLEAAFVEAQIPLTLLKGAALNRTVYGHPAERVMSDVDLWVHPDQMQDAFELLQTLGFSFSSKTSRPPALQQLSLGELPLYGDGVLIELHWSPFPGWWLQRTAAVDDSAVWARREPAGAAGIYQLGPEDTVLHLAIHLAINHQFGLYPLRSLVDIARTAQQRLVDWAIVARRAQQWRVATATWCTLALLDELIGVEGMAPALAALRPHALRRRLLAPLVNTERLLARRDLHRGRARYLLLLLLVDRPRDAARLILRTLWPEDGWMEARYQGRASRRRHLWNVIRHGQI